MENITIGQILGVISGITIIIGFVKLIYELLKKSTFDKIANNTKEIQELKVEANEYKQLLTQIDKKCDVITEKIANGDKMDELKLQPLTTRIENLEKAIEKGQ